MLDHVFETTDAKASVVRNATRLEDVRSKKQVLFGARNKFRAFMFEAQILW